MTLQLEYETLNITLTLGGGALPGVVLVPVKDLCFNGWNMFLC